MCDASCKERFAADAITNFIALNCGADASEDIYDDENVGGVNAQELGKLVAVLTFGWDADVRARFIRTNCSDFLETPIFYEGVGKLLKTDQILQLLVDYFGDNRTALCKMVAELVALKRVKLRDVSWENLCFDWNVREVSTLLNRIVDNIIDTEEDAFDLLNAVTSAMQPKHVLRIAKKLVVEPFFKDLVGYRDSKIKRLIQEYSTANLGELSDHDEEEEDLQEEEDGEHDGRLSDGASASEGDEQATHTIDVDSEEEEDDDGFIAHSDEEAEPWTDDELPTDEMDEDEQHIDSTQTSEPDGSLKASSNSNSNSNSKVSRKSAIISDSDDASEEKSSATKSRKRARVVDPDEDE